MKRIALLLICTMAFAVNISAQTKEFFKLLDDAEMHALTQTPYDHSSTSVTRLPGEVIRKISDIDPEDESRIENRIEKMYFIKMNGRSQMHFFTRAYEIAQKEPFLHYTSMQEGGRQYMMYKIGSVNSTNYLVLMSHIPTQQVQLAAEGDVHRFYIFYIIGDLQPEEILDLVDLHNADSFSPINNSTPKNGNKERYSVNIKNFDHEPLANAVISVGAKKYTTDKDGNVVIESIKGRHATISKDGYSDMKYIFSTSNNIQIILSREFDYHIKVVDEEGKPISNAIIDANPGQCVTDINGEVHIKCTEGIKHIYKKGYEHKQYRFSTNNNPIITLKKRQ